MSSRLILMACAMAFVLAPVAMAEGMGPSLPPPEDPANQPPAPDTQNVMQEARFALVAAKEAASEARDQAQDAAQQAADQAQADAEAAMAEAEALAEEAQRAIEGVLNDAQGAVEDLRRDAERRVADVTTFEEPAAQDPEAVSYAPEANMIEVLSLREPLAIAGAAVATAAVLFWLAGSTGLTGAGQASGTLAGKDLRKLLPYASPLFTRFERDTVLGHPKREALYAEIMTRPGVTLQDLCEETGLSRTAVSHHLRLLEQQHLIVSKRVGRSRHFFENGGRYGRDQKDAYAVLHNDRSKDVHEFIAKHPGAIQKDLCEALAIQASVAHWHVKRLEEARLIEAVRQGRTVSYFPTSGAGYA